MGATSAASIRSPRSNVARRASPPARALAALALGAALLFAGCGDDESEPQGLVSSAGSTTTATGTSGAQGAGSTVELVPEAERAAVAAVLAHIDSGAPLPYEQDGATFQNREGLLPDEPIGYYREYTVPTPGSDDRGARRLVIGEGGETYYTNDHYASFEQIEPEDFK